MIDRQTGSMKMKSQYAFDQAVRCNVYSCCIYALFRLFNNYCSTMFYSFTLANEQKS